VEKYCTARQATGDNIIRRMRFACRMTKVTDTHSEHVILIAFPQQQWLRERSTMIRYMYVVSLVFTLTIYTYIYIYAHTHAHTRKHTNL
jgi:hypothetical protein